MTARTLFSSSRAVHALMFSLGLVVALLGRPIVRGALELATSIAWRLHQRRRRARLRGGR